MTRLQADLALLLVAVIWGAAFVAQKDAMSHIGPYTYVAVRFAITAVVVLPFALREHKRGPKIERSMRSEIIMLCLAFIGGVVFQQTGIERTSVTNSGFLTGLYVLFVPVICRIVYKQELSKLIFPAALLSVAGVGMLSGGLDMSHLNFGDVLILLCAVSFGFQVTLIGRVMAKVKAPLRVSVIQYTAVAIACAFPMFLIEKPTWDAIYAARWAILYGSLISGCIAYTLQVVAQQYAPASDSAVIMSAEAVFAAIFGIWLMNEKLSLMGFSGCVLIIIAILLVEFTPYIFRRKPAN